MVAGSICYRIKWCRTDRDRYSFPVPSCKKKCKQDKPEERRLMLAANVKAFTEEGGISEIL